jgi:hypothetical protein
MASGLFLMIGTGRILKSIKRAKMRNASINKITTDAKEIAVPEAVAVPLVLFPGRQEGSAPLLPAGVSRLEGPPVKTPLVRRLSQSLLQLY